MVPIMSSGISPLLETKFMGKKHVYLESVDSTSTFLANMHPGDAIHGTVVIADRQTAGRGRMRRSWYSPPGTNLYFSLLLSPDTAPAKAPQLALITAVALIKILKNKFPGLLPTVKWPNDILLHGRKLAGILCEMQTRGDRACQVIIGVGVNVNGRSETYDDNLRDNAISLLDATGRVSSRQELIADILTELEACYELWMESGLEPFIAFLDKNSAIRDRRITVFMQSREITGIARGLSHDGRLQLETPGGTLLLSSGEVHVKDIHW